MLHPVPEKIPALVTNSFNKQDVQQDVFSFSFLTQSYTGASINSIYHGQI